MTDPCHSGLCGSDVPPLVGSVLTGTGLTLAQAAARLAAGEPVELSDVQRRLVEEWATAHPMAAHPDAVSTRP